MNEIPFFATTSAFAMRVGQLSTTLYDQMDACLASYGIELPGYTTSIVQSLYHGGPQSISDLAQQLELSHQLASQRVNWLVREGFATSASGAQDRRTRIVSLSRAGRAQAAKLQEFLPILAQVYDDLFDEIGVDLHDATIRASVALKERSLAGRFSLPATTASKTPAV